MTETNTGKGETKRGGRGTGRTAGSQAIARGRVAIEKKNQALTTLKVVYVPHSQLKPNPWNPNRQDDHTFELLQKSMREDGFTQPIIVNDGSFDTSLGDMICDGEHRWRAAAVVFGSDCEVPIVYVPYTPEQMRISTLRHNLARGEHDLELTAQLLADLQQLGALEWAQDSLMMDDTEVARLLDDIAAPDQHAGEEYSEAWAPDKLADEDVENASTTVRTVSAATTHGGVMQSAMTPAAIEATRERERKLKDAKTEEERVQARKESNIFRISLIYSDTEADIVRTVLGDKPAIKLLEICRSLAAPSSTQVS
ncbi:MAG: ParB N-terminal domain-containing protein [Blastocatellia bacterium]